MYHQTSFDAERLKERAIQFKDQLKRHSEGKTSAEEFRPLRLQNGLYIQRHAPMLRIAIAYGMLNTKQLRMLSHITKKFDRGYGHLTTRQNMQLNWIKVNDVPKALALLAEVGLHGIQASGNCLRNITSDALAGIAKDELLDPRPYAEVLRQWSTFHPELSFLPRKFKVAFTGATEDRALIQVHDLAFEAVNGEPDTIFKVRVGGGLGRTPILGPVLRERLHFKYLLSYTHAVMRVYNELGRRDNMTKARIKILVRAAGIEKFKLLVEEEFQRLKSLTSEVTCQTLEMIKDQFSYFRPPSIQKNITKEVNTLFESKEFNQWKKNNVIEHKIDGLKAVLLPVKGEHRAPGDVTSEELDILADLCDKYSDSLLRVTHSQNFIMPAVPEVHLEDLYQSLKKEDLSRPIGGLLTDMVCCPGGDFCSLANARSIPIAEDIATRFKQLDQLENLGPIDLRISGCINSCGHHHIGHIGILGVDKNDKAYYQLLLGGHSGNSSSAKLGKIIGKAFAENEIVDAVEEILECYISLRLDGENLSETLKRLGNQPFADAANLARKNSI
ncbi:MAG: sulfite reductase [Betaproteobacteria bacterium TMED82]|nr:MAG: sulfite reductase [Betaproteobacteria bacterium TMED82]